MEQRLHMCNSVVSKWCFLLKLSFSMTRVRVPTSGLLVYFCHGLPTILSSHYIYNTH
jgi:hypothetical protein